MSVVAFRVAYLISGDADDAADAAQEGFIKAYYALDRFHADLPFRPWLLRIVTNEAKNRARSGSRRANLAVRYAIETGDPADPSPEATAIDDEEHRALTAAIAVLREDDRLVVSYCYLLELSEAETADALNIPRGTVKSRLSRALDRLRTSLNVTSRGASDG